MTTPTTTVHASASLEPLLDAIAAELQQLPPAAAPRPGVAATVANLNGQVATAAAALLAMEDHPGRFDPWCRVFAQDAPGR